MLNSNNAPLIPLTPGVVVRKMHVGTTDSGAAQLLPDDPSGHLSKYMVNFSDWLEVGVATRLQRDKAIHRDSEITVLFDGLLTDVVSNGSDEKIDLDSPALTVLALYKKLGKSAPSALRGSFVALIVDETSKTARIFTDRRSSRPIFFRQLNGTFYAAAPTVTALAQFHPTLSVLHTSALLEFMMSLTFRGDSTLYREVTKLPSGSMLTLDEKGTTIERYWQMRFAVTDRTVDNLLEECDSLLEQSVQRLLRTPERKLLFLSGGVDSRVILGYLRRHLGSEIDVAYYWSELTEGDDAAVARQLADTYKLRGHRFEISMKDFVSAAPTATFQADCRSEVIDSAPLYQFFDTLSQDYDGYINGDESFGWHRNVNTVQEALNEIGWFGLEQVRRLRDWLDPELAKQMEEEIRIRLQDIVSQADEENPDNLKDKLFYEERLGNMLNGFSWAKLHRLEGFRPLVDEDVIDFVCTLPNEWRGDKQLLRRLLKIQFPDIAAMPVSKKDVLPTSETFLKFLQSDEKSRRFFEEQLTSKLDPRLASIFSTRQFKDSIPALLNGTSLPPIQGHWLSRMPGLWRLAATPENRVAPFLLVLRLLQLNLHLTSSK